MKTMYESVKEFHKIFNVPILESPQIPSDERQKLRFALIDEEYDELKTANDDRNIVEVADALADLIYVIIGQSLEYGINIQEIFDEVHRSNMTKLWPDGKVHHREDGKVIKPPTYSPPNLKKILKL